MAFRRGGFTLIEALVVIFVIGILVALIIPAVIAARQVSRRIECSNKLKEIGLAITGYVDDNKAFPIGVNGKSALARLLPYLGKEPLYNSMNFVAPPEGVVPRGANLTAHQTTVQAFICLKWTPLSRPRGPVFSLCSRPSSRLIGGLVRLPGRPRPESGTRAPDGDARGCRIRTSSTAPIPTRARSDMISDTLPRI